MALPARKFEFEMERIVEQRTALEERVDHIQKDVGELKTDVRRIESKFDAKFGELSKSLSEHRLETEKSFGALRLELRTEVGSLRSDMKAMHASLVKWMVATLLGTASVAIGVAAFLK